MPNYSYVIDSSFRPFSMQEMLTPFTLYKDAFEKTEEAYIDLSQKADKFKYLANNLDPNSKAAQIYNGYANDLKAQAEDLAKNGLNMSNRRGLTLLKRRYQGEIGMLDEAKTALDKELDLRRQIGAKDPSMLYAAENLNIDDYLNGGSPNLYSISGTDLYSRGVAAGKAASSRVYSAEDGGDTLGGYYKKWVEKYGYSKEAIDKFRVDAGSIPELQMAADAILKERGVFENLSGNSVERARQSVLNGIIDGAVTQTSVKPIENLEKKYAIEEEKLGKQAAQYGLFWNKDTKSWNYEKEKDPAYNRAKAKLGNNRNESGKGKGTQRYPTYDKSYYVSGAGTTFANSGSEDDNKSMDTYRRSATRAHIKPEKEGIVVKIGEGESALKIGEIKKDASGKLIVTPEKFTYGKADGNSKSFADITRTSAFSNHDNVNISKMLYDIVDVMEKEGDDAYNNYHWYLSPRFSSDHIDKGGFLRDNLKRDYGTLYNGIDNEGFEDDESFSVE